MKQVLLISLLIVASVLVGFFGIQFYLNLTNPSPLSGSSPVPKKVKYPFKVIVQPEKYQQLLTAAGYSESETCTFFDLTSFPCSRLKNIDILYTSETQPYLNQSPDANTPAFASVGGSIDSEKFSLIIHVDPKKMFVSSDEDKYWWVAHQVIRSINWFTTQNPSQSFEVLLEKDKLLFSQFKNDPFVIVKPTY